MFWLLHYYIMHDNFNEKRKKSYHEDVKHPC